MRSKLQLSLILSILMLMLVAVEVSATNIQTTRRISSQFTFDRAYGSSAEFAAEFAGQHIIPQYAQLPQTTRRIFSGNFYDETPVEQERTMLLFVDPLDGDGSFLTTRRVSSSYQFNRGYGRSRTFNELMLNGVFITF